MRILKAVLRVTSIILFCAALFYSGFRVGTEKTYKIMDEQCMETMRVVAEKTAEKSYRMAEAGVPLEAWVHTLRGEAEGE